MGMSLGLLTTDGGVLVSDQALLLKGKLSKMKLAQAVHQRENPTLIQSQTTVFLDPMFGGGGRIVALPLVQSPPASADVVVAAEALVQKGGDAQKKVGVEGGLGCEPQIHAPWQVAGDKAADTGDKAALEKGDEEEEEKDESSLQDPWVDPDLPLPALDPTRSRRRVAIFSDVPLFAFERFLARCAAGLATRDLV